MISIKKVKQTMTEDGYIMTTESTSIETDDEFIELNYSNYCFDKEGMENMARRAMRMIEDYSMNQELEELEEENYIALSERYKSYSLFELMKKLFE